MELMITDFVPGCASHVKSRFALNKISACAPWLYIYPVCLQANEGRLKVSKKPSKAHYFEDNSDNISAFDF